MIATSAHRLVSPLAGRFGVTSSVTAASRATSLVSKLRPAFATSRQASKERPCRFSTTTESTYYDSQSGQHVPVHDERHVSVFGKIDPATFGWDDQEFLHFLLAEMNADGALATMPTSDGDPKQTVDKVSKRVREVATTKPHFTFFLPADESWGLANGDTDFPNVVPVFKFDANDQSNLPDDSVSQTTQKTIRTALLMDATHGDAMLQATAAAQLIDRTGLGHFLILQGNSGGGAGHGDDILELAEELSYLDVVGATMQSRMMVDLSNTNNATAEEVLADCLAMGLNKFAIDEERLKWVGHYVRDQTGKECSITSM